MMKRAYLHTAVFALIFLCSLPAFSQSAKNVVTIADPVGDRTEIKWVPKVPYSRIVLTVLGPDGEVTRHEVESGTPLSFKPGLLEGNYTYELRLIPALAPGIREALSSARARGDEQETVRQLKSRGQLPTEPIVQSGSFLIFNGVVFLGAADKISEPEPVPGVSGNQPPERVITPNDVVVPDDQIVQGSLCVGLDCVNNENFGFDTIRLKENNTRIAFVDTSSTAGFATRDWRIRANDSASGGRNGFFIDDMGDSSTGADSPLLTPFSIIQGAPTNSMVLSSTGRLGLRTSTPTLDIHVNTGDTPAMRLEQNSSSGFTAQTWDVGANEANFFIRDITSGSRLPFRIRPGAPTSSIDIAPNGNVGIGVADATSKLTVDGVLEIRDDPNSMAPFGIRFPDGLIQTSAGLSESLHIMGSSGSVDEDSTGIFTFNNFVVGVRDGSSGTVNVRYNLTPTSNLTAIGRTFTVFKIRYRESDVPGTNARVTFTGRSTNINAGGNTVVFTFDSNNEASTGAAFVTLTKCDNTPGTDFDFSENGYWIEASITRTNPGDLVQLGHIQISKSTAASCP